MPGITLAIDLSRLRSGVSNAVGILNNISAAADRAQNSLSGIGGAAGDSVSGIKRLASQVLALIGTFKALEAATAFLQRGIEFGSSMESSRIGIASLISTMTDIRDAQGNMLEGQEKYNAAMEISARMMERIQILGLETTATSQELVQGVQSIIAPALQAGIALDKLPDFAVQSAQAMQAMGIPLQQMRTEIEALLTGNLNGAQDLLAPRLGLTGDDIRSWKEQGVLIDKLMARLKMFETAGKDVAQTWTGIKSNFSEAIDILSGQISSGLTENLKQALTQMQNLMVSVNRDTGEIGISDDFINIKNALQELSTMMGEQVVSATQTLISHVKELNASLKDVDIRTVFSDGAQNIRTVFSDGAQNIKEIAGALAGAMLAYKAYTAVVNSAAVSSLQMFRADTQTMGTQQALRERILKTNNALYQKIQVERQAAQIALTNAEREKMLLMAQERRAAALAARTVGTQNQARAEQVLASVRQRLQVATDNVTAAELRLAAATKGANALKTAFVGLGSAVRGLMGIFGGPWGFALTAATATLGYLATQESAAEKYTRSHAEALLLVSKNAKEAAKSFDDYVKKFHEMSEEEIKFEKASRERTQQELLADLNPRKIAGKFTSFFTSPEDVEYIAAQFNDLLPENFKNTTLEQLDVLKDKIRELGRTTGELDLAEKFVENIEALKANKIQLDAVSGAAETVTNNINWLGGAADSMGQAMDFMAGKVDGAATAVGNLNNAVNGLDPKKLKGVIDDLEFKKYLATLSERQKAEAQAMRQAGASNSNIRFAMSGMAGPIQPELYDVKKLAGEAYTPSKSASRGASQVENARRSLEVLRTEIAKLNGESSAAGVTLEKKFNEIERIGTSAKLSGDEIARLKTEYANAFKADTLRAFNKEMLQLEGNTTALRNIEIDERVKQWEIRLREAGISAEEAKGRVEQLRAAMEKEAQFKDLQTAASFYKDLAQRTGDYNISLEYQTHLLQEKARIWNEAKIPMQDVGRMQQLMALEMSRVPWDGMVRGLNKFGAEATNTATQIEGALTNAFDGASDALADFVMQGKIDFNSFANSIISDLARIAARQATGNIASGLGSLLGGLFNSPFSASSGESMANTVMGINNGMMNVFGLHSGGMAWESPTFTRAMPVSSFEDAPRFHSGRLPWNPSYELPAIIRRDESVLTPGQMSTLAGMGDDRPDRWDMAAFTPQQMRALGAREAAPVEININPVVIDRTERGVSASVNQTSDGMGNLRFEVIIDEIDRRMAQRTQNRQSQTANAINKVNGLNSANSLYRG